MYVCMYIHVHIIVLRVNCCMHFPIKGVIKPCTFLHNKRMCQLCQDIVQIVCKFSDSFIPFSLASVKKRPHTLHRWFTCFAWISIQYGPFYSLINRLTQRDAFLRKRCVYRIKELFQRKIITIWSYSCLLFLFMLLKSTSRYLKFLCCLVWLDFEQLYFS